MPESLRSALTAALTIGLFAACEIDPQRPELQHALNTKVLAGTEVLQDDPTAQDQILGALEMLCGSPSNPGYLPVEEWIDDEFDPNDGSAALSDDDYDALLTGNEVAFSTQLAHIAAGDFDKVVVPNTAPGLVADWQSILDELAELEAAIAAGEAQPEDLAERKAELAMLADPDDEDSEEGEAVALFTYWYPSLHDSAELYRVQCLHCHGISGGGDGPTANFLEPRPRDYRYGIFKNTALNDKSRPRHGDLVRTLEEGIYGTSMPNFRRLSDAQLHGLADYVKLLSIRGETELLLALEFNPDEGGLPFETVKQTYLDVWEKWDAAPDYVIAYDGDVPSATPEGIANGKALFHNPNKANCVSCHGENGRGDGPSAWEADPVTGEQVRVKDDWGNPIIPRRLHLGMFRFGRRPIDIYRRIFAGINGSPMPSHAAMKDPSDPNKRLMSDDDLWDIVHYVRSLSVHEIELAALDSHAADSHADGHDGDSH